MRVSFALLPALGTGTGLRPSGSVEKITFAGQQSTKNDEISDALSSSASCDHECRHQCVKWNGASPRQYGVADILSTCEAHCACGPGFVNVFVATTKDLYFSSDQGVTWLVVDDMLSQQRLSSTSHSSSFLQIGTDTLVRSASDNFVNSDRNDVSSGFADDNFERSARVANSVPVYDNDGELDFIPVRNARQSFAKKTAFGTVNGTQIVLASPGRDFLASVNRTEELTKHGGATENSASNSKNSLPSNDVLGDKDIFADFFERGKRVRLEDQKTVSAPFLSWQQEKRESSHTVGSNVVASGHISNAPAPPSTGQNPAQAKSGGLNKSDKDSTTESSSTPSYSSFHRQRKSQQRRERKEIGRPKKQVFVNPIDANIVALLSGVGNEPFWLSHDGGKTWALASMRIVDGFHRCSEKNTKTETNDGEADGDDTDGAAFFVSTENCVPSTWLWHPEDRNLALTRIDEEAFVVELTNGFTWRFLGGDVVDVHWGLDMEPKIDSNSNVAYIRRSSLRHKTRIYMVMRHARYDRRLAFLATEDDVIQSAIVESSHDTGKTDSSNAMKTSTNVNGTHPGTIASILNTDYKNKIQEMGDTARVVSKNLAYRVWSAFLSSFSFSLPYIWNLLRSMISSAIGLVWKPDVGDCNIESGDCSLGVERTIGKTQKDVNTQEEFFFGAGFDLISTDNFMKSAPDVLIGQGASQLQVAARIHFRHGLILAVGLHKTHLTDTVRDTFTGTYRIPSLSDLSLWVYKGGAEVENNVQQKPTQADDADDDTDSWFFFHPVKRITSAVANFYDKLAHTERSADKLLFKLGVQTGVVPHERPHVWSRVAVPRSALYNRKGNVYLPSEVDSFYDRSRGALSSDAVEPITPAQYLNLKILSVQDKLLHVLIPHESKPNVGNVYQIATTTEHGHHVMSLSFQNLEIKDGIESLWWNLVSGKEVVFMAGGIVEKTAKKNQQVSEATQEEPTDSPVDNTSSASVAVNHAVEETSSTKRATFLSFNSGQQWIPLSVTDNTSGTTLGILVLDSVKSTPAAPGILLGTGYLDRLQEPGEMEFSRLFEERKAEEEKNEKKNDSSKTSDGSRARTLTNNAYGLFVSRDGGRRWEFSLEGEQRAEFLSHGDLIVAVEKKIDLKASIWSRDSTRKPASGNLRYSLDQGYTWKTYNLDKESTVHTNVLTHPSSYSYMLFAESPTEGLSIIDMSYLFGTDSCRREDLEIWGIADGVLQTQSTEKEVASERPLATTCHLGQRVLFARRRRFSMCASGATLFRLNEKTSLTELNRVPVKADDKCECGLVDYMCEVGFVRVDNEDLFCHRLEGLETEQMCSAIAWWETSIQISKGYARIPGNRCVEVTDRYSPYEYICTAHNNRWYLMQGTFGLYQSHPVIFALFMLFLSCIALALFGMRKAIADGVLTRIPIFASVHGILQCIMCYVICCKNQSDRRKIPELKVYREALREESILEKASNGIYFVYYLICTGVNIFYEKLTAPYGWKKFNHRKKTDEHIHHYVTYTDLSPGANGESKNFVHRMKDSVIAAKDAVAIHLGWKEPNIQPFFDPDKLHSVSSRGSGYSSCILSESESAHSSTAFIRGPGNSGSFGRSPGMSSTPIADLEVSPNQSPVTLLTETGDSNNRYLNAQKTENNFDGTPRLRTNHNASNHPRFASSNNRLNPSGAGRVMGATVVGGRHPNATQSIISSGSLGSERSVSSCSSCGTSYDMHRSFDDDSSTFLLTKFGAQQSTFVDHLSGFRNDSSPNVSPNGTLSSSSDSKSGTHGSPPNHGANGSGNADKTTANGSNLFSGIVGGFYNMLGKAGYKRDLFNADMMFRDTIAKKKEFQWDEENPLSSNGSRNSNDRSPKTIPTSHENQMLMPGVIPQGSHNPICTTRFDPDDEDDETGYSRNGATGFGNHATRGIIHIQSQSRGVCTGSVASNQHSTYYPSGRNVLNYVNTGQRPNAEDVYADVDLRTSSEDSDSRNR